MGHWVAFFHIHFLLSPRHIIVKKEIRTLTNTKPEPPKKTFHEYPGYPLDNLGSIMGLSPVTAAGRSGACDLLAKSHK